jgi:predicted outer membrane repeat protein
LVYQYLDGLSGGGGIFTEGSLTVIDSTISSNVADAGGNQAHGGGIMCYRGSVVIEGSTISSNTARSIDAGGGGLTIADSYPVRIDSSTIWGNTAVGLSSSQGSASGGGVELLHISSFLGGPLVLTDSTLAQNAANATGSAVGRGGAIYLGFEESWLDEANVTIADNSASTTGGGIYFHSGSVVSKNTIIADNTAGGGPDDVDRLYDGLIYDAGNNLFGSVQSSVVFRYDFTIN